METELDAKAAKNKVLVLQIQNAANYSREVDPSVIGSMCRVHMCMFSRLMLALLEGG